MCILNITAYENCRHFKVSTTMCDNPERRTNEDKLPLITVPADTKSRQDAIRDFLARFGYEVFKCKRYECFDRVGSRINCRQYGGDCGDAFEKALWYDRLSLCGCSPPIGAAKGEWYEDDVKGMERDWSGQCAGLVINGWDPDGFILTFQQSSG